MRRKKSEGGVFFLKRYDYEKREEPYAYRKKPGIETDIFEHECSLCAHDMRKRMKKPKEIEPNNRKSTGKELTCYIVVFSLAYVCADKIIQKKKIFKKKKKKKKPESMREIENP